jgi:hypothetical protein
MSRFTVDICIDLFVDGQLEELDEATVAARIAAGDTATLRAVDGLDGRLRIGEAEVADELFAVVQHLCFNAVIALLRDGAVFDYSYFSSNASVQLRAEGDSLVLSGSEFEVPETTFPRCELLRRLYACGERWITTVDGLGRSGDVNHLRPFAEAAQSALAAAGLAWRSFVSPRIRVDQAMSAFAVDICVDLLVGGRMEELDEATVAARIAAGDTDTLRAVEALDGRLRIGQIEISDELASAVQRLCFVAVTELVRDGAVFDYPYFSAAANVQLRAAGDTVVVSGSEPEVPETTFSRRELLRGPYACGERWITTVDGLGRYWDVNQLRPFAAAAHAAAGLA